MHIYSNRDCANVQCGSPMIGHISRDDSVESRSSYSHLSNIRPRIMLDSSIPMVPVMPFRSTSAASSAEPPSYNSSSFKIPSSIVNNPVNNRFPVEDVAAKKVVSSGQTTKNIETSNESIVDSWTKDSIKSPVSGCLDDKVLKKEAPTLFKLVQCYMGDRKSKTSPDQVLFILLLLNVIFALNILLKTKLPSLLL